MKQALLLFFTTMLFLGAAAQNGKKAEEDSDPNDKKYYDLLMYYMDSDFEKCIKKSIKITEDEETSKDPLPYLYASMCYYEVSLISEMKEKYPDAFKEALKYAVKYRKKDEKSSQKQGMARLEFWDENKPYFEKLRKSAKVLAEGQLDEGAPAKAEYYYKQILLFDPQDYSSIYMLGQLRLQANDKVNGDKYMLDFENQVKTITDFSQEPQDKVALLKYGFMEYASYLIQQGRSNEAKAVITHLTEIIGKDPQVDAYLQEKKLQ